MCDINPVWIAAVTGVGGVLTALFVAVTNALFQAKTNARNAETSEREQDSREWKRALELIELVNNTEGKVGNWHQQAAFIELVRLSGHQVLLRPLVESIVKRFSQTDNVEFRNQLEIVLRNLARGDDLINKKK